MNVIWSGKSVRFRVWVQRLVDKETDVSFSRRGVEKNEMMNWMGYE
jgi:hypothetical protein